MNNLLTSAFALASIALSLLSTPNSLAYPTDPIKPSSFDASVYVTKDNKIRLAVEKTTAEPLTINLHQVGSKTALFSRLVSRYQTKAVYQLDVDQLVDGAYELEIKSVSGIIIKQVSLGFPAVVSSQRLTTIYQIPYQPRPYRSCDFKWLVLVLPRLDSSKPGGAFL